MDEKEKLEFILDDLKVQCYILLQALQITIVIRVFQLVDK